MFDGFKFQVSGSKFKVQSHQPSPTAIAICHRQKTYPRYPRLKINGVILHTLLEIQVI